MHLVEGVGGLADLRGARLDQGGGLGVAAEGLGGVGEAVDRRGDAPREQVARRDHQQQAAQKPQGHPPLPGVGERRVPRSHDHPAAVRLAGGGDEGTQDLAVDAVQALQPSAPLQHPRAVGARTGVRPRRSGAAAGDDADDQGRSDPLQPHRVRGQAQQGGEALAIALRRRQRGVVDIRRRPLGDGPDQGPPQARLEVAPLQRVGDLLHAIDGIGRRPGDHGHGDADGLGREQADDQQYGELHRDRRASGASLHERATWASNR